MNLKSIRPTKGHQAQNQSIIKPREDGRDHIEENLHQTDEDPDQIDESLHQINEVRHRTDEGRDQIEDTDRNRCHLDESQGLHLDRIGDGRLIDTVKGDDQEIAIKVPKDVDPTVEAVIMRQT